MLIAEVKEAKVPSLKKIITPFHSGLSQRKRFFQQ